MHRLNVFAARPKMALFVVLLLSAAGISDAQTKIKSGFNLFSPQDDVQIGQQSAAQAEQQLPIVNDAQTNAYINRLGERLAANRWRWLPGRAPSHHGGGDGAQPAANCKRLPGSAHV